jgi:hypothetical protein
MSEPVYTQNSQKDTVSTEKRVQKVVKDAARTKKNDARKLADIFISEDIANVKNYIFMDVLVPAIKKAIYDIVTNGIDMFLYGGSGKNKNSNASSKVSYRSYYDQKSSNTHRGSENTRPNSGFDYDDIIFDSRGEAEAAKVQMHEAIVKYGFVTVADLYDMAGLTAPYTSQKYGWMSMNGVEPSHVRDGYVLKLPRAIPID